MNPFALWTDGQTIIFTDFLMYTHPLVRNPCSELSFLFIICVSECCTGLVPLGVQTIQIIRFSYLYSVSVTNTLCVHQFFCLQKYKKRNVKWLQNHRWKYIERLKKYILSVQPISERLTTRPMYELSRPIVWKYISVNRTVWYYFCLIRRPFALDDNDENFLCRQRWVVLLPMVLFILDDKGKIMHYHCCQCNPFWSCRLVRTVLRHSSHLTTTTTWKFYDVRSLFCHQEWTVTLVSMLPIFLLYGMDPTLIYLNPANMKFHIVVVKCKRSLKWDNWAHM